MKHLLLVLLYVFSLKKQGFYFKKYFYLPVVGCKTRRKLSAFERVFSQR